MGVNPLVSMIRQDSVDEIMQIWSVADKDQRAAIFPELVKKVTSEIRLYPGKADQLSKVLNKAGKELE